MRVGEFDAFAVAFYHSAVNYTRDDRFAILREIFASAARLMNETDGLRLARALLADERVRAPR